MNDDHRQTWGLIIDVLDVLEKHGYRRGDARTVSPQLRDTIAAVYDAWWDKRPPERNRPERAAATAARRRAIRGNWCAGAALDDDELDTPGYRPASGWHAARGTGTATDIHPAAREQMTELGA